MTVDLLEDEKWMQEALDRAICAKNSQEVPVGAVLVLDGKIMGEGWNNPIGLHDCTAHAEVNALRAGGLALGNYRLPGSTLYVTLEPCILCVGAILHARIQRLVFGAYDPKTGAVASVFQLLDAPGLNHRVFWRGGVRASESSLLLQAFFKERRKSSQ
jgi:tRNA(adenine34) deaminase